VKRKASFPEVALQDRRPLQDPRARGAHCALGPPRPRWRTLDCRRNGAWGWRSREEERLLSGGYKAVAWPMLAWASRNASRNLAD